MEGLLSNKGVFPLSKMRMGIIYYTTDNAFVELYIIALVPVQSLLVFGIESE